MSSQVAGRLQVNRSSRRMVALAAIALDPQRLARWVRTGRAGALEATRLLAVANEAHLERLRARMGERALDSLLPELEQSGHNTSAHSPDSLSKHLPELALSELVADSSPMPELGGSARNDALDGRRGESLEDVLADDAAVLAAAFATALTADGFAVDSIEAKGDGVAVRGLRGAQRATIEVDRNGRALIDVDRPGFVTAEECTSTRDGLVNRLKQLGVSIQDPKPTLSLAVPERKLAAKVERAVRRSLPGFEIRSMIEGDELQIIALPQREQERSEG